MEFNSEYSISKLNVYSYRLLQQMAKSMKLPSNVKKVELIEMIHAKKCYPKSEAERIVNRVKMERQHLKQEKKRGKVAREKIDASDSEPPSPPISITPKRPVGRSSGVPLAQVIVQSKNSVFKPQSSDRVLRSCHIKPVQKYINKNLMKHETGTVDQTTQMNAMRIVRKHQPNVLSHGQMVPISQTPTSNVSLVKRRRLLSGIYPLNGDNKEMNFQVQSVGVRDKEGNMKKINAFIQKNNSREIDLTKNVEITLQDIIDGNLDANANLQNLNRPDTSEPAPTYPKTAVYQHKKLSSDQISEKNPLPPIQDVFSQIKPDPPHTLYVYSDQDNKPFNYPFTKRNTNLLETVYNFKSQYLPCQPFLHIATTSNTTCVYSTPIIATAVPHKSLAVPYSEYMPKPTCERDSQCQYNHIDSTRMTDLRFTEDYFGCIEDSHSPLSSDGTADSHALGANVTISDMVEDALEIISQDGDYMEQTGMDLRMQCVLCNWAGPKILLEHHIRKDHISEIDKQEKRDWNISYSLGTLVNLHIWSCRVIEYDSSLFVLSVKYEQPDKFKATLSSLSIEPDAPTGSITIYNKVTGQPHAWAGEIREIPPNLPYDNDAALTLTLSELNLLPNSANLKLVNGELVLLQSPSKVVFRQELNDIHVILFVKLFI